MSNILLTGGTGLIGHEVSKALSEKGHKLFVVTRNAKKAQASSAFPCHFIEGHLESESLRNSELAEVDAVINMMGETIDGRWTSHKKQKIYDSRAKASQNLIDSVSGNKRIKKIISFSAIGYYGNRGEDELIETSVPGEGFLSQVCKDWEKPWQLAISKNLFPNAEISILRMGMVLAANGGAFNKLKKIFGKRLGSVLGSGQQWVSWIHIQDVVNVVCWALEQKGVGGIYNTVAPQPVRNIQLSKTLAESLHRGMMPRVPAAVLKIALGEMSALVLDSQKVSSQRLQNAGFQFQHPDFKDAVQSLLV
jgi:uncharacterized protein (TIGR01777 family)